MQVCNLCKKGYISHRDYQASEIEYAGANLEGKDVWRRKISDVKYDFCSNVFCTWQKRVYAFKHYEPNNLGK